MRYNPDPPYNVLATDCVSFGDMQRVGRFARYWELIGNSGRFRKARALLLGDAPFERFMRFSDWLFAETRKTHQIALERLYGYVHAFLTGELAIDAEVVAQAMQDDYAASGARGRLEFLDRAGGRGGRSAAARGRMRQARHQAGKA